MWTTCHDPDIEMRQDFEEDAPKPRYRGHRGRPEIADPPHPLSRGARHDQDTIPDIYRLDPSVVTALSAGPRIYNLWRLSGNMYTRHTTGYREDEFYTLFHAYSHGLSLGACAVPFRNAVIEAVIELLDDYDGPWHEKGWRALWDATVHHPKCPLRRLVTLKFVLSEHESMWTWLGPKAIGDEEMLALAKDTQRQLPVGRKGRETWQEVVDESTRFHEPCPGQGGNREMAML
ncbi:hypothetical protein C7974DRAFT_380813 [Boeremia exigua]|uniref:uncharacterized protein n=1 Tax=Boeremia exigua TaxID=749465 RepID=UPI001E8DF6A4|nr:uncharacterized protein C7974DRAFT_380813 [Boeremia exigua]KAH6613103.1 hypothetical protein C7974DRAFT_380813 [Boeremia exigua]